MTYIENEVPREFLDEIEKAEQKVALPLRKKELPLSTHYFSVYQKKLADFPNYVSTSSRWGSKNTHK